MAYRPDICLFHFPCSDGITAAAIVFNHYAGDSSIEFVQGNYSNRKDTMELIESWRGKHVLMVDFSYPADFLEKAAQSAESVVILDHHKTAQAALADYVVDGPPNVKNIEKVLEDNKIVALFDMKECGATMTWKFFNPGADVPEYIQYIRDVDINLLELPRVHDFKWATRAIELNVGVNAELIKNASVSQMKEDGVAIKRFVENRLSQLKTQSREGIWGQIPFRWVITDYAFASDAANSILDEGYRLGVAVYFTLDGLGLSLRSTPDLDCSAIAKEFGGGGHGPAAGANIKWEDVPDFIEALVEGGVVNFDPAS